MWLDSKCEYDLRRYRSGWNEQSISLEYQTVQQQSVVTHSVGSTPTDGKACAVTSTQSETTEVLMKKFSLKANLKGKWIVGLLVLTTLGLCGVFPARSNAPSFEF